jgi:transmembrane 9 superfamily member 2/4
MAPRGSCVAICMVLAQCLVSTSAYLPGVGPRRYKQRQPLELELNELTSMRTQVPYDFYSLPFCPLAHHKHKRESLGEQLEGEVAEESAFKLEVNVQVRTRRQRIRLRNRSPASPC